MFEKTRIKYDEKTGVKTMEKYNPVTDTLKKIKEKTCNAAEATFDFVGEYGWAINLAVGTGFVIWLIGVNNGIDLTNKTMLESYKNDEVNYMGDGTVFKKSMRYSDWMKYLDNMYNTKGGKKRKNIKKYLKENGYTD